MDTSTKGEYMENLSAVKTDPAAGAGGPGENRAAETIRTISELVENESVFDSRGYSIVKVTKDGVEEKLRLPIKSSGVAEFMEKLAGDGPRPPVTRTVIKKNSPEGRELGLPHDQMTIVFDTTDEGYVDALNAHNKEFNWKVAIFALDIKWTMEGGREAQTYEEKKKVLSNNGITINHINRIYQDVEALTQFTEDREDFLSGST